MVSRVLPLRKREVVVRGDGNYFYRTIAMWSDGKSDRNHGEFIRRLCGEFIERHPYVFHSFLFKANSVREHVKKNKLTGTWTESVDIFSCATLLQRTVFTFSLVRQQWNLSRYSTCVPRTP